MRHLVAGKKLNRNTAHRISMLRNMTISLIQHEQIVTTLPKAVFLRPFAEKMITMGRDYLKSDCPHRKLYIRRLMIARLGAKSHQAVEKILSVLSVRYKDRDGGYSRIIKYKYRSDSTQTAVIELVERNVNAKGKSFSADCDKTAE
jgi:large subunit ribosomal protein L17